MVTLFDLQDPAAGALAVEVVRVLAVKIALRMFIVVVFSALPAGGDSKFPTFLDCGVMWLVGIPVTFFAVHGLGLPSVFHGASARHVSISHKNDGPVAK